MEIAKFSPRAKSKTRLICIVKGCHSRYNKDLELRFHNFPPAGKRFVYVENALGKKEKIDQLTAWMKACKVKNVNSGMKVCSLHFHRSDYILPDVVAKRRCLKVNVVPSCNLPNSKNKEARDARKGRTSERSSKKIESQRIPDAHELVSSQRENDVSIKRDDVNDTTEAITEPYICVKSEPVWIQDFDGQVHDDFLAPKLMNFITSDAELSTLTGIETLAIFDSIVAIATDALGNRLVNEESEMNIRDKVLMTYVKLKQNMSFDCLAILTRCCSAIACRQIFLDTIRDLSECLKSFIEWPSREKASKNMPRCFEGFDEVRVILDCTEIFVRQPAKSETCKIMTGATPAGDISYVSGAFDGETSDKAIFDGCGIKDLLQPGDGIMVDEDFNIDEECIANNWKCYRSPSTREEQQLTESEAILRSKIAEARAHMEQLNRRIRKFKIVAETMSSDLVAIVEDIFLVICATVNFSSTIIKEEKFMPS